MTKPSTPVAFVFILMLISAASQAQFVAIRLEIPAGVQFSAQVMDPAPGGTWENSKARKWVQLQANENLSILVQLQLPAREIQPTPAVFFLNDGSADFDQAVELNLTSPELYLSDIPRLIRYMKPMPLQIKAWLGIPVIDGLTIKIEYP